MPASIVTTKLIQSSIGDDDCTTPVSETSNPSTSEVLKDLFTQKKQAFVAKLSSIDAEVGTINITLLSSHFSINLILTPYFALRE